MDQSLTVAYLTICERDLPCTFCALPHAQIDSATDKQQYFAGGVDVADVAAKAILLTIVRNLLSAEAAPDAPFNV